MTPKTRPFSKTTHNQIILLRLCVMDVMHGWLIGKVGQDTRDDLRNLLDELSAESDRRFKLYYKAMDEKDKKKKKKRK